MNVIGSDKSFRHLPEILASTGLALERFATLVHPAASVSSRARLGHGVVVNPGVVIGGGVLIGDHVMLCPGCIVGHESSIGDYSILAPGSVVSGLVERGVVLLHRRRGRHSPETPDRHEVTDRYGGRGGPRCGAW